MSDEVEKKFLQFSEYVIDEFEGKIIFSRQVLEEKSAFTGGVIGSAVGSAQQGIAGGIQAATGIPVIGSVIGAVFGLGGKELLTNIEKRLNKKEADAFARMVFETKDKCVFDEYKCTVLEACFELFFGFERQLVSVRARSGGEARAMMKVAKYFINAVFLSFIENPEAEFTVEEILKGVVGQKSVWKSWMEGTKAKVGLSKLTPSDRQVLYGDVKWSVKDLFTKTGIMIDEEFLSSKDSDTETYWYRRAFPYESDNVDAIKNNYDIKKTDYDIKYDYVLKLEKRSEYLERTKLVIWDRDPKRQEDRLKETINEMTKYIIKELTDSFMGVEEALSKLEKDIWRTLTERNVQIQTRLTAAENDRNVKHTTTVKHLTEQTDQLNLVEKEIKETSTKVDEIHQIIVTKPLTNPIFFQLPPLVSPFIGRVNELSEIKWAHVDKKMVFVHGEKGMGKTTLAVNYAHEYKHNAASNVVWINSETNLSLVASFRDLAVAIGNKTEDKNNTQIIKETVSYFSDKKTLYVFDNACENNLVIDNLNKFFTVTDRTTIIVTSRHEIENDYVHLPLGAFTPQNSIDYIETVLKRSKLDASDSAKLAEFHNNLPLAISEAVAHIVKQNLLRGPDVYTIDDYINEFGKKPVVPPCFEVVPKDDDSFEEELERKFKEEAQRIGNQVSDEAARAEENVREFFEREIVSFFKGL